ncbi:MAG: penicillin-binding protein 2 [Prevotella sp.]|nr:penicillin-binding protein 2 [Candidatus Equicola faecalis]
MTDYELSKRSYVLGGVAVTIIAIFVIRLFYLQVISDEYKKYADSNAFLKRSEFPARGVIKDRNNKLMVYNQMTYDLMVVMNDINPSMDTISFCRSLGITKDDFIARMDYIKDRGRNPSYSRFTQQMFYQQLNEKEYCLLEEKMFRYPGFYIQKRAIRQYSTPYAAHVLGEVAQVSAADIEEDNYYQSGDYIGKMGVERSYEKQLRGQKGVHVLLRDARGKIRGAYKGGAMDTPPRAGRDITLGIDAELQERAEQLMKGRRGSIIAIEPSTGEVLCMVSAPSYDPRILTTRKRGEYMKQLQKDKTRPLLNRAIMGQYPPGSTFKPSQALTFMQERILNTSTSYPCAGGFRYKRLKIGCHAHPSPLNLYNAIATSCNGYFCWGLYYMLNNRSRYSSLHEAMSTWRDYMVSMGFGYKLGIDMPGEKRGLIPNAEFYDQAYAGRWNALTILSIAIGQGEVMNTPLQIANQAATIANRGYYIIPHVVKQVEGERLDTTYSERHYTMVDRRYYEHVVRGMRDAVTSGTCRGVKIPGYSVCGKTGTAQNRGGDHSVFMGFAPMHNPRIALVVYVENGGFGADSAVPIAARIFNKYLNHL